MKVLITGSAGFIGNHVTRFCIEQGDDVRAMVMPGEDQSPLDGLDLEIIEGDLLNKKTLEKCVKGVDGIYHLAGLFSIWTKDPDLHLKVNVEGTNHLMKVAMESGVEKVVYTSSIAAFGVPDKGELLNEETLFKGWECAGAYVMSKFVSHNLVKAMVVDGLPATIVCPGFPFGPGDRSPTPTGSLIVSILKGKMKNYFEGGISAVDVRDVARGHLLAMEKGKIGETYLLANKDGNISQREFARLVGDIAEIPDVAVKEISPAVMKTVAKVLEAWSFFSGRPPLTTIRNSLYALREVYSDPTKAIEELGLPQTPIEIAVKDSIDWFRDNGYV